MTHIRGLVFKGDRPDLIIIEDENNLRRPDSDEYVKNELLPAIKKPSMHNILVSDLGILRSYYQYS